MKRYEKNKPCKQLRTRLAEAVGSGLGLDDWAARHVSGCSRCQARLAGFGRLETGLNLLKSQSHSIDLLRRANNQALRMLNRRLREEPQAAQLQQAEPKPGFWQRLWKYTHSVGHAAACLVILLMMKAGIFSSLDRFQSEGELAVKRYYQHHLGEDGAEDIFYT